MWMITSFDCVIAYMGACFDGDVDGMEASMGAGYRAGY